MAQQISKRKYLKNNPWVRSHDALKQRCNYPKHSNYKYYGGKGIKAIITIKEMKQLWFRDKAYKMKRPSIDRKNKTGDYTFVNCQFIELGLNSAKDKFIPTLQYDLKGNFIKRWNSQKEASENLGIHQTYISKVVNGRLKSTCGFKFKVKGKI